MTEQAYRDLAGFQRARRLFLVALPIAELIDAAHVGGVLPVLFRLP